MNFYTFHLMYTKSNRKLRELLCQSIDSKTEHDVELNVPDVDSIVQISLGSEDSKHKCKQCLAGFQSRSLLRKHVSRVHKVNRAVSLNHTADSTNSDADNQQHHRWKCSYCLSRFRTRDLKNAHQKECRQMNASGSGMTGMREREFVDYNDFDASEFHSGSETNNGDDNSLPHMEFKYEVNSKIGPFGEDNSDNLTDISEPSAKRNENWKCKKCAECFSTLHLLHLHQSNEHPDPEHKLFPPVSIKQEQLDYEELHLKTEIEKLARQQYDTTPAGTQNDPNFRWKCKTCSLVFETREILRTHRRSHVGYRKLPPTVRTGWNCSICNEILPSRDKVRLHKDMCHPKEKRGRRSNDEAKNWGDVGQYECELCNKAFISKSKIRKHMDVHKNKDRPKRLCTICGLELCSTYNLNNHIRTVHGRERKFHCTLCDRRFSHSHHLKTHMNRHDGIRPFKCQQCVKAFFDKTTLREHIKSVHLNLKAYACRICARTFNRSGNMRAHMLKTHNLGDLSGVGVSAENSRPSDGRGTINEPSENEGDEFTPRFHPNQLGEPFRSIMKMEN